MLYGSLRQLGVSYLYEGKYVNTELEKENPLISKEITEFVNNKAVVRLTTRDTDLAVGTYYYDVQVNTADGRVDTVLGPAKFKIVGGVKF